jgi:peptidoglycan/xylan/chitin deacetylase (PgdA/CDA1 family)
MATRPWTALRRRARDAGSRLLLDAGLTHPARSAAGRLTVVTLHRVLPPDAAREYPLPQLAVTPDELAWLVAFFQEHFTCDTLSGAHRRFAAGEAPERPLLAVTFDDAQLDNHLHARPVLDRAGLRATFFAPVDAVREDAPLWHDRLAFSLLRLLSRERAEALRLLAGLGVGPRGADRELARAAVTRAKTLPEPARAELVARAARAAGDWRPPWDGSMRWAQLRELAAAGHEIGSHTLSHPLLTRVGGEQLEREVAGSKAILERELGVACEAFCYPNGDCDDRVVEAVRRAGYRVAVVTAWGPNGPGADPLRLTRCDLQGETSRDAAGRLSAARLALRVSPMFARLHR